MGGQYACQMSVFKLKFFIILLLLLKTYACYTTRLSLEFSKTFNIDLSLFTVITQSLQSFVY